MARSSQACHCQTLCCLSRGGPKAWRVGMGPNFSRFWTSLQGEFRRHLETHSLDFKWIICLTLHPRCFVFFWNFVHSYLGDYLVRDRFTSWRTEKQWRHSAHLALLKDSIPRIRVDWHNLILPTFPNKIHGSLWFAHDHGESDIRIDKHFSWGQQVSDGGYLR